MTNLDRDAAGRLALAQQRLARGYPFHARFLSCWRLQPTRDLATVGVTVRQAAVWLLYNPGFVTACSLDELSGVLHHEINHLLFGHPWEDPRQYPDRSARVVAEEVTVNEWVPEPLPGRPILLRDFPQLPPDEDTTTRYRRLAGRIAGPSPAAGSRGSGLVAVPEWPLQEPKNVDGEPENDPLRPLDDHGLWAEIREAGAVAELATRAAVRGAYEALEAGQRERLPAVLRRRIGQWVRGVLPGGDAEALGDVPGPGAIDWRRALRHFVRQVAAQPTFARPPRRFPELLGVVPGNACRPLRARVMAILDTSGSIATGTLQEFGAELGRMRRDHEVVVVECDAAIHSVYPFTPPLRCVRGRGGTDLRPPFAAEVLSRIRPDVVVYCTDGAGPAPAQAPGIPVLWCLTAGGTRPAPWGRTIQLPDLDPAS